MLQLKNILCWIGDEEEHTLLEHSASTREDEVTAEIMLGENQASIRERYVRSLSKRTPLRRSPTLPTGSTMLPTSMRKHLHPHFDAKSVSVMGTFRDAASELSMSILLNLTPSRVIAMACSMGQDLS